MNTTVTHKLCGKIVSIDSGIQCSMYCEFREAVKIEDSIDCKSNAVIPKIRQNLDYPNDSRLWRDGETVHNEIHGIDAPASRVANVPCYSIEHFPSAVVVKTEAPVSCNRAAELAADEKPMPSMQSAGKRNVITANVRVVRNRTNEAAKFRCDTCQWSFTRKAAYRQHMAYMHNTVRIFVCKTCDASFKDKAAWRQHQKTHAAPQQYTCDTCNETFVQKINWTLHLKRHNTVRRQQHKCNVCDKCFTRKDTLNVHKKIHDGIKPFKCHFCDKSFGQKQNLISHLPIHTGLRPFICDICNMNFARKITLKLHMSMHSGVRPFQCSECNKSFAQKSHFKMHTKNVHAII